jgi:hypothetical protein
MRRGRLPTGKDGSRALFSTSGVWHGGCRAGGLWLLEDDDGHINRWVTSSAPLTTSTQTVTRSTPTTLTHRQLLARVNAICVKANCYAYDPTLVAELSRARATNDGALAADATSKFLRFDRRLGAQLHALVPPGSDKDALRRFLHAIDRQNGLYARLVPALRANDATSAGTLNQLLTANSKARVLAAVDLGADRCGKP